tara:strand:- start:84 stop:905 length:822 start_codon:yes stop_codon:yes gene_type:complete
MKHRHNKKRNTAFVFEALVKELAKSTFNKQHEMKNKIISLIKEHFRTGTEIAKELEIYKNLTETGLQKDFAEKILNESKRQYDSLNKEKIFEEQSNMITKINKLVSRGVFSNFVPNYKHLASIYQILNGEMSPKKRVILENELLSKMADIAKQSQLTEKVPADLLIFKTFAKKFNEAYDSRLFSEQKELLSKYVTSFVDNGINLKIYLNEEIGRIKTVLAEAENLEEISTDPEMLEKTKKVLNLLEDYKHRDIDSSMVEKVLKIQNLVREINN